MCCLLDLDQGGNSGIERNFSSAQAIGWSRSKRIRESQWSRPSGNFGDGMPTFLYRCPNTGLRVQGWIANDPTERDEDSFETVNCPACGRVHLVNPQTGKVLGGANDNAVAQQTLAITRRGGSKLSQLRGITPLLPRPAKTVPRSGGSNA